jgi:hypothetical protein
MGEHEPSAGSEPGADAALATDLRLTETQRNILEALCRPRASGNRYATPATNQEIAGEVFLSVDAVKAHLRVLYRKFGVEELPHNQKRARLVELVLEGDVVEPAPEAAPPEVPPPPATVNRRVLAGSAIATGFVGAALALGVLAGDSDSPSADETLTEAGYRSAVNGFCGLARSQEQRPPPASMTRRAGSHLAVIETMRGRLASIEPPPGRSGALDRFSAGLDRAAEYTTLIAQEAPGPQTRAGANAVAELTLAAGQIQAGAIEYGLGPDCSAIGNVVARSARNAAGAP